MGETREYLELLRFSNSLVGIFIQRRRSGYPIAPINPRVDDHGRCVLDGGGEVWHSGGRRNGLEPYLLQLSVQGYHLSVETPKKATP